MTKRLHQLQLQCLTLLWLASLSDEMLSGLFWLSCFWTTLFRGWNNSSHRRRKTGLVSAISWQLICCSTISMSPVERQSTLFECQQLLTVVSIESSLSSCHQCLALAHHQELSDSSRITLREFHLFLPFPLANMLGSKLQTRWRLSFQLNWKWKRLLSPFHPPLTNSCNRWSRQTSTRFVLCMDGTLTWSRRNWRKKNLTRH